MECVDGAHHSQVFDGLMGWSILTDSNRIMSKNPACWDFHNGRKTNDRLHVVTGDEESRTERTQLTESHSVHDRPHGVFTNTEMEVASAPVAPAGRRRHEMSHTWIREYNFPVSVVHEINLGSKFADSSLYFAYISFHVVRAFPPFAAISSRNCS